MADRVASFINWVLCISFITASEAAQVLERETSVAEEGGLS